ncbi:MAG: aldo/keto reductase [Candidatus Ancillula sp.]|jgi:diketogulonate reductase-like aldo/keto reductase|nr:aldo/keto reductase [Candidatus Ancillula sp.]
MVKNEIPQILLNDGNSIPQIGVGALRIPDDEVAKAIEEAIDVGYRQIDGAAGYFNEKGVGLGLKNIFENSDTTRDDLWITSKVRDSFQGYDKTMECFDQTLRDLGVDYLDMYMIHWPVPEKDLYLETWKAFERLKKDGRVKTIGVCNFLKPYLQRLLDNCEIKPAVNQLEIHPSFQQKDDVQFTRNQNVAVQAYSPMARALDLESQTVIKIAKEIGKTPAQVILRWHIQQNNIIIPKSVHKSRLIENINIFDFELSEEQMDLIYQLDNPDGSMGHDPNIYSYS